MPRQHHTTHVNGAMSLQGILDTLESWPGALTSRHICPPLLQICLLAVPKQAECYSVRSGRLCGSCSLPAQHVK